MKSSALRQTPPTDDHNHHFVVPALLLAVSLTIGGLTLMLGTISAETAPATSAPASESTAPTFVGA